MKAQPTTPSARPASDHRPSTPAELFAAYRAASEFKVAMSFAMEKELEKLCARKLETVDRDEKPWFTPEDVTAVVQGIRAHLKAGTGGFTDASLNPRRVFGEDFEFRVTLCRAKARRRKPRPQRDVPQTDRLGITRLVPEAAPEPLPVSEVMKKNLADLRRQILPGGAA